MTMTMTMPMHTRVGKFGRTVKEALTSKHQIVRRRKNNFNFHVNYMHTK